MAIFTSLLGYDTDDNDVMLRALEASLDALKKN